MQLSVKPEELASFLAESGLTYKTTARSYVFTCPRCDKKDKLCMFRADGRFICWVCADSGFKGRPEYALKELTGSDLKSIRNRIYGEVFGTEPVDYLDVKLSEFLAELEDAELLPDPRKSPKPVHWPLDFYPIEHGFSTPGAEYLARRGVCLDLAVQYGIRYSPVQRRVCFPMIHDGRLVGWQARAVFDTEWVTESGDMMSAPKALTTGPRDLLMFGDRLQKSEHAVICEGPMDAIKCHLVGGNVATLGKSISQRQVDAILSSNVRRVYLALDPDAAQETMNLAYKLSSLDLYLLTPAPGFKDFGEMSLDGVADRFQAAERYYPGELLVHFG